MPEAFEEKPYKDQVNVKCSPEFKDRLSSLIPSPKARGAWCRALIEKGMEVLEKSRAG